MSAYHARRLRGFKNRGDARRWKFVGHPFAQWWGKRISEDFDRRFLALMPTGAPMFPLEPIMIDGGIMFATDA